VIRRCAKTHEMDLEEVNRALLRVLADLEVERPAADPLLPQRCGLAVWRSGGLAKIQPFALRLSKGFDLKASGI
jgi:hypothetical protein